MENSSKKKVNGTLQWNPNYFNALVTKNKNYDLIVRYHTTPRAILRPSHKDMAIFYRYPNEQIDCIGGGNNQGKKVYCYKKPIEVNKTNKNESFNLLENERFGLVGSGYQLYPYDVYNEEKGEFANELHGGEIH